MNWIWLGVWIALIVGSISVHEIAHVLVGKHYDWTYHGVIFKPSLFAVGVDLRGGKQLWKVAAAGPWASFELSAIFFLFSNDASDSGRVCYSLAMFNLALAVINLIPLPLTDGSQILKGLRNRSTT